MARKTGSKKTAGGLSKIDPFYRVFNRARCRCTDPGNKDYPRYGGRGITFEWKFYLDFKKDMYNSWLEHKSNHETTSLERINNNGNYSKANCKWITMKEQAKNKRTSTPITCDGVTLLATEWADKLGVPRQTIGYRLRHGWRHEDIIKIPFSKGNNYKNGKLI